MGWRHEGLRRKRVSEVTEAVKISRAMRLAPLAVVGLLTIAGCGAGNTGETGQDEEAPGLPARPVQKLRVAPEYRAVEGTEGALRQATLYSQKLPTVGATFEVRSVVLSPRMSPLPADRETLYEVLAGQVESQSGGERQLHSIGNLWMVSPGERWTVKAKGEVAVLRAIVISAK
jgi:hypothetical protein